MNIIPVAQIINAILAGVVPHTRDGVPVTNREGTPLLNVSCIIPPTAEGAKLDTLEVRVPAPGVAKQIPPYTPVKFVGLVARAWSVDGRSGVSFSADSVAPASPKAAA
jgi:hypothetical protein